MPEPQADASAKYTFKLVELVSTNAPVPKSHGVNSTTIKLEPACFGSRQRTLNCHRMVVRYWKFIGEFTLNQTSCLDDSRLARGFDKLESIKFTDSNRHVHIAVSGLNSSILQKGYICKMRFKLCDKTEKIK
jgi:hypothetical protein